MAQQLICTSCGHVGKPKKHTRGSIWIEILLWLCMLIPGLFYTMWRYTTKEKVCPSCLSPDVIPLSSPKGQKLMEEYGN